MTWLDSATLVPIFKIIWIDLLLSGDNAMVIALACRELPPEKRKLGILLGAGAAVGLRVVFTLGIAQLMQVPYLKIVGGLLLFWIAVKLLIEDTDEKDIDPANTLWKAVRIIVIADAVMSLDNVIAVAAAAHGSWGLIVFGLLLSIPIVIAGSSAVMWLMDRYPIVIWAGAALLGSLAGGMLVTDIVSAPYFAPWPAAVWVAEGIGAALVVAFGWWWNRRVASLEPRVKD
ncbi:MAG: TerC family protein [Methylobacteriaceae bacterium]|nr:TerC family protein [Methylobacteriaceae bacterium]